MSAKSISPHFTPANAAQVLALLAQTPKELKRLSAKKSTANLDQPLRPHERTFKEVVAHLINCEARTAENIYAALLLAEPEVSPLHAERDWGKLLRPELLPFKDLLTYFTLRRAMLLPVLTPLTLKQWARTIKEPGKQRRETVYGCARGLALHEAEHVEALKQFRF